MSVIISGTVKFNTLESLKSSIGNGYNVRIKSVDLAAKTAVIEQYFETFTAAGQYVAAVDARPYKFTKNDFNRNPNGVSLKTNCETVVTKNKKK